MNKKLTLTIDKAVIEKAKRYAKAQGRSLSNMIENYLMVVVNENKERSIDQSPITSSLKGSFSSSEGFDYKEALSKSLWEKHQNDE